VVKRRKSLQTNPQSAKSSLVLFSRTTKHNPRKKLGRLLPSRPKLAISNRVPTSRTAGNQESRWPYLLESAIFYLITGLILRFISPQLIADLPLTNAFLPLHLALFLANLFLLFSLLKNWRQAIILSLAVLTLVFLKLQQIILSWQVVTTILLIPGLMFAFDLYNRQRRNG